LSERLRRTRMPSGIVQSVGKSRTGKPTVTIDGQIYSASKVDLSGMGIGDKIEFESASSVYNGATVWFLNAYKILIAASSMGPGPAVTPNRIAVPAPSSATLATPLAPPQAGLTEPERLTISNWVAAVAGRPDSPIKDPVDLIAWAGAAKSALRKAAEADWETDIP
jgi:hypothetical protein